MVDEFVANKINKPLPLIDVIKFIMAFCVIMIHVEAIFYLEQYEIYTPFFNWLIRLAVPFFFTVSGFLLARKFASLNSYNDKFSYLSRRIKRLLRIFGYWLLIYFPMSIYHLLDDKLSFQEWALKYIVTVIFRGQSIYAWPLWYLYSMIIVFTIILFIFRFRYFKSLLLTIFAAICLINWYGELASTPFFSEFKYFTFYSLGGGMPILFGMCLFAIPKTYTRYWFLFVTLVISILLYCFKMPYWEQIGGVFLCSLGLCLDFNSRSTFYPFLRQQSMWIYYIHMYVLVGLMLLLNKFHSELPLFLLVILSCGLTFIISSTIIALERFPYFRKLKILVS